MPKKDSLRKNSGFQPVKELVAQLAASLVEHPNSKAQILQRDWRRLTGEQIASHSEPVHLIDGLLTIRVDSPVWSMQLSHMKPALLDTMKKKVSNIRDIRFVQGALRSSVKKTAQRMAPPLPPPLPDEQEKAAQLVARVEDPDLRAALKNLFEIFLVTKRCG